MSEPGRTDLVEHTITMTDDDPDYMLSYRRGWKKELWRMLWNNKFCQWFAAEIAAIRRLYIGHRARYKYLAVRGPKTRFGVKTEWPSLCLAVN